MGVVVLSLSITLVILALQPVQNESEVVVFEVQSGQSLSTVGENLKQENIIRSTQAFRFVANQEGLTAIKAGKFRIDKSWTNKEILEVLNNASLAIPDQVRVTLPEGFWAKDIAQRMSENTNVSKEALLELWNNETYIRELMLRYDFLEESIFSEDARVYLEGYLFPETYDFFSETTAEAITTRLLDQTQRVINRNQALFDQSDMSIHEVFTLASIVQYEARSLQDMKMVSGVFHNRLNINMPLQASPTVCYSLYEFDSWLDCERQTQINSPYNTYVVLGLPPGPILNPSEMALIATLEPTQTSYMYFMADVYGDGTIYFAETLAEHEANVDKYLRGR